MMRLIATLALAMTLTTPALAVAAATGSGTVNFAFTRFTGPYAGYSPLNPVGSPDPTFYGVINNTKIVPDGAPGGAQSGSNPDFGYATGSTAIAGNPNSVEFRYNIFPSGDPFANLVSFAPANFSDIALGQDFKLGTLTFKNGGWYGAGETAAYNTPTLFDFTMSTSSLSGAAFNQTITGTIVVTVNSPSPNDLTTLAGQEAEADWVSITSSATVSPFAAFRVFDLCCKPTGGTNIGTVDVIGRFNSLDLVGFTNPQGGGFLTQGTGPLPPMPPPPPPPPPAIPEPASWAMLIAGFGLVGATLRRRRALAI